MLKAVLDTNLFVSSIIIKKGAAHELLQAWREHKYILITSRGILKELETVLHYPHIKNKYHLLDEDIESLVYLVEHEAVVLPGALHVDVIKEDPEDNKILACGIEAGADYIISGDHHLLGLGRYKKTVIISAREFLRIIR